jgi:hypothetical protein
MTTGWLGPWGYLLRVPLLLYGLIHVRLVGHFLLLSWPAWGHLGHQSHCTITASLPQILCEHGLVARIARDPKTGVTIYAERT